MISSGTVARSALCDEAASCEVVDEGAIHLPVEIEIEGIERVIAVTKARVFVTAFEQSILATQELVGDDRRDEIDWGRFSL